VQGRPRGGAQTFYHREENDDVTTTQQHDPAEHIGEIRDCIASARKSLGDALYKLERTDGQDAGLLAMARDDVTPDDIFRALGELHGILKAARAALVSTDRTITALLG
jgi:hypothetical protein